MEFRAFKTRLEKALFGTTLEEVYDQVTDLSKKLDRLSASLDHKMAALRRDLASRQQEGADPRAGVYVVEDDCIGCQICVDLAPEVFRLRSDGIAEVHDPKGTDFATIKEAADRCGSACIKFA